MHAEPLNRCCKQSGLATQKLPRALLADLCAARSARLKTWLLITNIDRLNVIDSDGIQLIPATSPKAELEGPPPLRAEAAPATTALH